VGRFGIEALTLTVLLAVAQALSPAHGQAEAPVPPAQEPLFRVDVKLVRLLVTVKDGEGKQVGSLNKGDFNVFDNGAKQELALFERHTEQPLSVALLVDTSASTAKELRYELDSVHRFLKALVAEGNPQDAVKLFSFNYDVTIETGFTRRLQRLETALKGLRPEGGTSLYDAIYAGSKDLEDRDGRHVVVVVTDGGDTTSVRRYQDALEAAQLADAVIYSVLVMPITNDAGRNIGGENALTTLSGSTGGGVFAPSIGPALDRAFSDILTDLRTQYLVGFYPRNVPLTRNRYHSLKVQVIRPDLRAISRTGYYGDSEQSASREQEGRGWTRIP
jgi:Ca-activated chloride channel family protein